MTLFGRKFWIAGLGHSAAKRIEHARVLPGLRQGAEAVIEMCAVSLGQAVNCGYAEPVQVLFDRWADTA
jgi:hypothetical protein